jgi:hypothetical protein
LHVKNLPAGEFVVYVQFSGRGPVAGLKNVSISAYGLQGCVPVNNAPCANIPSGIKNQIGEKDEGNLQDNYPVRDPTERMRGIPTPNADASTNSGTDSAAKKTKGAKDSATDATKKPKTEEKTKKDDKSKETEKPKEAKTKDVMPGTTNVPTKLNVTMDNGDDLEADKLNPEKFQIDDS